MKVLSSVVAASVKATSQSSFSGTEGCYASVVPLRKSVDKLRELRNKLVGNIQGVLPLVDWHTTVIYSKDNVDAESIYDKIGVDPSIQFLAKPVKVEYWDGHKGQGVLVLVMKSDGLTSLHARFRRLGLTPTFDPYVPHMTLASDFDDPELGKELAASLTESLDDTVLEFCGLRVEDVS